MAESRSLHVADDFSFPLDLVVYQTAILARTGAGKTNAAVVIVEEVLAAGEQCVIIDPPGAWHGLRSSADGQAPGFPVIVLGGTHGDLPLEPSAGRIIADFVVDTRASVILDLSEFSGNETTTFVTAFAERLYHRKGTERSPVLLVFEEGDELAPQRPMPGEQRMLGAIERIAKRGRMRGIGTLFITQRSASLNKNVLSQIGVLIAMQTTDPRDIAAIDDWVKHTGDQERRQQLLADIAQLPTGTAFVWSPSWLHVFRKVRFRRRRTFDSSATPKPGEVRREPKHLADVDLAALRERMTATIEKAKQDDPQLLRQRIAELERELKKRPTEVRTETVVERVEEPVVTEEMLAQLSTIAAHINGTITPFIDVVKNLASAVASATPSAHQGPGVAAHIRSEAERQPPPLVPIRPPVARNDAAGRAGTVRAASPMEAPTDPPADLELSKSERKILETLGRIYPLRVTRSQLATLTNFTASGGAFQTYFGTLKRNGLLLDARGEVQISRQGLALIGITPAPPETAEELQEMWFRALPGAGEKKLLGWLVGMYPDWLTREELAERTGYTASGGAFQAALGLLRRNDLIELRRGGYVRAHPSLFLDAKGGTES